MKKSYSKYESNRKKSWKSRTKKVQEVTIPQVLFSWRQPPQEHVTPWLSLWPNVSFDTYVDPFFGSGLGWVMANNVAQKFFVNDRDYEYICAMRIAVRGEQNLRKGINGWLRIIGLMDAWPIDFLGVWHSFHLKQIDQRWNETHILKSKITHYMEVTLQKLIEMHEEEFIHHGQYFKNVLYASLVAVFKKCFILARNNGSPLQPEALANELQKAMRYTAFMYAQYLYNLSFKLGKFTDTSHVISYIILHSIAEKDQTGQWKLRTIMPFKYYEKSFRIFESPIIHAIGRKTEFQHNEASVFLKQAPNDEKVFTFIDVPEYYTSLAFKTLYDLILRRNGLYLILVPEKMANTVNHIGYKKTWIRKGVSWGAISNYGDSTNSMVK